MKRITLALVAVLSLPALAAPARVECTVGSVQGSFHSVNPPLAGDTIQIDLSSPRLGEGAKITFSRAGVTAPSLPYVYGFLGKGKPQEEELARYSISWTQPQAHLYAVLSVGMDLNGNLIHRWSPLSAPAQISRLDFKCIGLPSAEEIETDRLARPAKPIAYDCQHIPAYCPQFAVVGGVTCEATKATTGETFKAHSRKNGCWAEHAVVHQICAEGKNPPDFEESCHQGQGF